MANFKKDEYYSIVGTKETIPVSGAGTGTIETKGTGVVGTNTLFRSEMQAGSWLVDLTQDEYRKVISVESDTFARLSNPFTVDISALTTPDIIAKTTLSIRELSVIAVVTDGVLDGTTLQAGQGTSLIKTGDSKGDDSSHVDPFIADATGTIINVILQR